jgi:hypothetical protein
MVPRSPERRGAVEAQPREVLVRLHAVEACVERHIDHDHLPVICDQRLGLLPEDPGDPQARKRLCCGRFPRGLHYFRPPRRGVLCVARDHQAPRIPPRHDFHLHLLRLHHDRCHRGQHCLDELNKITPRIIQYIYIYIYYMYIIFIKRKLIKYFVLNKF